MTDQLPPQTDKAHIGLTASRQCTSWLADMGVSLAVTSYQTGKLFLFGLNEEDKLSVTERTVERCMGLVAQGPDLYVASAYQIWRFRNVLEAGERYQGYDGLYVPRASHITGDVDAHDLQIGGDGRLIFANTLFSCLATPSRDYSFEVVWTPPFISRLAAEDRCHLNGVALDAGGAPLYVTIAARTDTAEGWRNNRVGGGQVLDVASGEAVVEGLTMPHSPRWYRGKLWVCEAGTGQFGYCDLARGRFEPIAFCPGFLRGCVFLDDYAVITTSLPRGAPTFQGLPLDDALAERHVPATCGINVIDLRNGDRVHWIEFEGVLTELFEAAVLPGVRRPHAIGFKTNDIRRTISLPPGSLTVRPTPPDPDLEDPIRAEAVEALSDFTPLDPAPVDADPGGAAPGAAASGGAAPWDPETDHPEPDGPEPEAAPVLSATAQAAPDLAPEISSEASSEISPDTLEEIRDLKDELLTATPKPDAALPEAAGPDDIPSVASPSSLFSSDADETDGPAGERAEDAEAETPEPAPKAADAFSLDTLQDRLDSLRSAANEEWKDRADPSFGPTPKSWELDAHPTADDQGDRPDAEARGPGTPQGKPAEEPVRRAQDADDLAPLFGREPAEEGTGSAPAPEDEPEAEGGAEPEAEPGARPGAGPGVDPGTREPSWKTDRRDLDDDPARPSLRDWFRTDPDEERLDRLGGVERDAPSFDRREPEPERPSPPPLTRPSGAPRTIRRRRPDPRSDS